MKILTIVYLALWIITLGGCAGIHKQAFNKTLHRELNTIGLLEPATSGKYSVINLGSAKFIGILSLGDAQLKTNKFTGLMKAHNFNITDDFLSTLTAELQNIGYFVKVLKINRAKNTFLENYDVLEKDVDAYLDLTIEAEYISTSTFSDYFPDVISSVRLVKRESNEILYQDIIYYGNDFRGPQAVNIPADQQYFFKDFDALTSYPNRAMEGLKKGAQLVAKRIAHDLVK